MQEDLHLVTDFARPHAPAPLVVGGRPGTRFIVNHVPTSPFGVPGADLDGGVLDDLVDAVAENRTTSSRAVAASLWLSQYASWTVSPVLAQLVEGRLLDASLDAISIHSADGVISSVTFARPSVPASGDVDHDDEAILSGLVDRNLAVVVDRLRRRVRVSSPTLWGSVAAAFATGTRVLSWCAADQQPPDPIGDAATAGALVRRLWGRRGLDRHCQISEVIEQERPWLVVHRGACCLAYQTPTGQYCATCSLLDPAERTARLRETVLDHLRETR